MEPEVYGCHVTKMHDKITIYWLLINPLKRGEVQVFGNNS